MKKNYLVWAIFCAFTSSLMAQSWTENQSSLYYYSKDGEKVFMTPDYSSMAVYFKESPSVNTVNSFKSKISLFKSSNGTLPVAESVGNKGMIRLNSSDGLMSIKTKEERESFLSTYNLKSDAAYDVLPSFTVDGTKAWMTKRVTIQLADGVGLLDISETLKKYNATLVKNMLKGKMLLFEVEELQNQLPLIQELSEAGKLDWGTPDFKMEVQLFNDPLYDLQWHLNNTGGTDYSGFFQLTEDVDIDAPEAWEITTGSSEITVAVIDDGMNAHEDFPDLLPGYTPANNGDGTPESDGAHGVSCGGLIFAQHNGIGVMGVAPDVNAFSVNIFASGTTNADLADAVIWAVDQGADVLSNSWGFGSCIGGGFLPSLTAAFEYAATEGRDGLGCIILIASGNDSGDCVSYPANLDSVTAVGAVNGQGDVSVYSNTGSDLDITGPSNDIDYSVRSFVSDMVTTDVQGNLGYVSGNYEYNFGGTSAATPVVAGVAALVLSVDPTLTKSEVENILYDSAVDYNSSDYDTAYGHGLVNAYNAVIAAGGSITEVTFPDPDKTYYIDNLRWNVRLGANGSEEAYTTSTTTTGANVEWKISPADTEGYYYFDCVGGGSVPRLRSDQQTLADMHSTNARGSWASWSLTDVGNEYYYFSTFNNSSFMRLQVNGAGDVRTVASNFTGNWTQFKFTEVNSSSTSSFVSAPLEDLSIYPNQMEDVLNVSFKNAGSVSKIELVDLYGQTYKTESVSGNEVRMDVTSLNKGLYLIRIINNGVLLSSNKIIKK